MNQIAEYRQRCNRSIGVSAKLGLSRTNIELFMYKSRFSMIFAKIKIEQFDCQTRLVFTNANPS